MRSTRLNEEPACRAGHAAGSGPLAPGPVFGDESPEADIQLTTPIADVCRWVFSAWGCEARLRTIGKYRRFHFIDIEVSRLTVDQLNDRDTARWIVGSPT